MRSEFLLLVEPNGRRFALRKSLVKHVSLPESNGYTCISCFDKANYWVKETPEEIYYMLEGNGLIRAHTTGVEQVKEATKRINSIIGNQKSELP